MSAAPPVQLGPALACVLVCACATPPGAAGASELGAGSSSAASGSDTEGSSEGESASGGATDSETSTDSGTEPDSGSETDTGAETETAQPLPTVTNIELAYGDALSQTLELYRADPPPAAAPTTVVLAHGGLWQSGDKDSLETLCELIVARSLGEVACASINYRLSDSLGGSCEDEPGVDAYRGQLQDFAAALSRLQAEAGALGLDAGAMWVGGHSAGGHLALSLDLRYAAFAGACPGPGSCSAPRGAIGFEGIYDLAIWDAYDASHWNGQFQCATRKAFGAPPDAAAPCIDADLGRPCWEAGSPRVLAEQHESLGIEPAGPALLIHSPGDDWVDVAEAIELEAAWLEAFPEVEIVRDTQGACATGRHNELLGQPTLADCIIDFVAG